MASITVPAQGTETGPIRPLSILRDLPQVADLIELCFALTIDDEGQSYLQQMRRASHNNEFLRWAGKVVDSTSLPLSGFVWEENGRIVGNASLVYQTYKGRKIAMIANVATHPDHRRRGIGRALTRQAMTYAKQKGAQDLWLQVRDDNPTAINIYKDLGFVERARRTTYHPKIGASGTSSLQTSLLSQDDPSIRVTSMQPNSRDWALQREWLRRAHPDELSWYAHWDWEALAPGLWHWLYRAFIEFDVRQWAAVKDGKLLATVSWMPTTRAPNTLWVAANNNGGAVGLRYALEAASRDLIHYRRLTIEYPAGEMVDAFASTGFEAFRTLIWMQAGATS
jgi:ribosomal protein S18 acetylase RimI-like enzyme